VAATGKTGARAARRMLPHCAALWGGATAGGQAGKSNSRRRGGHLRIRIGYRGGDGRCRRA